MHATYNFGEKLKYLDLNDYIVFSCRSDPALFRIILGQHLQNPVLWTGHEIVMPIDSYYVVCIIKYY